MGGYGSGGWNATGRPTTADVLRLDVNQLNKAGALRAGFSGTCRWHVRGEVETVSLTTRTDRITLSIPGAVDEVLVTWEDCRFGGRRPFFCCPGCGERTLHLYRLGHFRCRACHDLSYPSQRERESDRAQRKANRIRRRLGGEPGWHQFVPRPKGMHRRTYQRLVTEIVKADAVTDQRARYLCG